MIKLLNSKNFNFFRKKSLDEKKQSTPFKLHSGRICHIIDINNEMIPDYYLVAFPGTNGQPTTEEVTEMIRIGIKKAKELSYELLGDEEAYSLLYSGYSARREKGWHIHIVLLGNRWKKARLYLILALKNLSQALRLRKDDSPKLSFK